MPLVFFNVTIPAGESLSPPVDFGTGELLRVYMPQQWTQPSFLSFQMSQDNTLYGDVHDISGREIVINVTPGAVILPGLIWRSLAWMKFRAGTRANPSPQENDRVFRLTVLR